MTAAGSGERVVVVFGGGGGIGSGVARRLATEGYGLVLAGPHAQQLDAARAMLAPAADAVIADVLDAVSVGAAFDAAAERGELHAVVNVAGVAPLQTPSGRDVLRVNLEGAARVCAVAAERLQPGGSVVTIGSVGSSRSRLDADHLMADPLHPNWLDGWDGRADDPWEAYAYAKRGVVLLTRRLAVSWGPGGVRANVVAPVVVDTALGREVLAEQAHATASMASRIPLRRICQPADVGAAVAFLVSDDASFITGVELRVDGGSTAAGLHDRSD